ncbi:hypothetical protein D8M04_05560 [Oceanobacillus piezotolerans]|uniref:ATPase n=1 Tax=Oceanobacillus piezotolerans TaxID=2448030 RepID=A0A498DJM8_9BACI|nr:hypothetical protein [Oceanobacillus piezotolerans]RLL46672.1 hypothetical protein D8M04_05560 [Oceanobacillus piezotolerans]
MKKYYVTGNTAEGFVNYIKPNLYNINKIIVLKHPSNRLKTSIIQAFITKYQGEEMEILKSPLNGQYLDGLILRNKSLAIVIDRIVPEDVTDLFVVDLDLFVKYHNGVDEKDIEKFELFTQRAYSSFQIGLRIHDDLEDIYINEMDFNKADALSEAFIHDIIGGQEKHASAGHMYHRLFGTNTADGVVNEVPSLIKPMKKVFYIKGRAGTGKSTFMKKVANACQQNAFDVEVYHCSFDPNSLDMVLVRELDFCLFDSTDPHEFFPSREGESIIDLYELAVSNGTDEKYEGRINEVNQNYKSYMKQGVRFLEKAGEYLQQIEATYFFTSDEVKNITDFLSEHVITID